MFDHDGIRYNTVIIKDDKKFKQIYTICVKI